MRNLPQKRAPSPFSLAAVALAAWAAGCATSLAPESVPAGERAIVHADLVLSAGLPVRVLLRQVDGRRMPAGASSVELAPGPHAFLVDCRIAETGSVQRFSVQGELVAGTRYRLVATTSARKCEAVELTEQ